jgi:hypothetical protein
VFRRIIIRRDDAPEHRSSRDTAKGIIDRSNVGEELVAASGL